MDASHSQEKRGRDNYEEQRTECDAHPMFPMRVFRSFYEITAIHSL
jgi:hypothetical protein